MKKLAVSLLAVAATPVFADTFLWTGAKDGAWTDPANWSDANGAAVSRCPGALDGTDKWHNWSNDVDTAVFVGAGNGHTTIDPTGLFSISNIVIRGAATPVYTFGDALPIRSYGSFIVEAEVVNMPVFGTIAAGVGYDYDGDNKRMHKGFVGFYNYAAQPLVIGDYVKTVVNPDSIRTTSSLFYWTVPRYHPRGLGGIRITGSSPDMGTTYRLYAEFAAAPGKTTIAATNDKLFGIYFVAGVANEIARVEIEEGCTLCPYNTGADAFGWTGNPPMASEISGAGTFASYKENAWNLSGKTLTISSGFTVLNNEDLVLTLASPYGPANLAFAESADNLMTGNYLQTGNAAKLTAFSIGAPNVKSSLGAGSQLTFTNETATKSVVAQELIYSGPGETSTRTLSLGRKAAGAMPFVLRQTGTGAWVVNMPIENNCANGLALTLDNATAYPAEMATALADGSSAVSITKTGSGVWLVSGACAYTGATTVSDGALVVTNAGSIAASDVTLAAGKTLGFAASETPVGKSLKSLTLTGSGTAVLAVGAGVTLDLTTLPSVPATALLNIVTEEGAVVTAMNFKGTKLSYDAIRLNGERAAVGSDGVIAAGIYPIDTRVDVQGGVISSDAGKIYGFSAGGTSGTVTLDGTAVTVDAIAQDLPATSATVTVGDGQTLTANALVIAAGGADLTIAPKATTGKVAVQASGLLLDNKSETGTLTVDAPLQFANGATVSKVGGGTAALDASGGWTGGFSLSEGTLTFADGARSLALEAEANPPVPFTFAATGASAALVKSAGSDSAVQLTGTSPATDGQTLEVRSGTVHITGEDTSLRYYTVNATPTVAGETASLVIDGGAKVSTQYEVFVGPKDNRDGARGYLTVSNATFCLDYQRSPAFQHQAVFVGHGKGAGGIMRIEEGAVVSNNLIVSGNGGSYGTGAPSAVYQRGGTVCLYGIGNYAYASGIGLGGYGYYEVTGGDVNFLSGTRVGNSRTSSGQWGQGVLFIGPGVEATSGEMILSLGYGSTYVIRSLLRLQGRLSLPSSYPQLNGVYNHKAVDQAMGRADIVVDGDNAYFANGGNSYQARTYLNGFGRGGAITLYAGTYQHERFARGPATGEQADTAPYYLNFNGGCLCANNGDGTGASHSNSFGLDELNRATVFARGAIVDSNHPEKQGATYHATLDAPLLAAPGNGIASVALPAAVADGVFVGPPFIEFEGDGTGAVAVAAFDSDTGKVTGVKVVSPGWNYTQATANFIVNQTTVGSTVLAADDFAPNARGPLTKRGPGVLHCAHPNEVSAVIVEAGTLKVEVAGAIPFTAALEIRDGSTVDMTTNDLAFASLSGTGGTITSTRAEGGVLNVSVDGLKGSLSGVNAGASDPEIALSVSGETVVDANAMATGTYDGNVTFAAGATVRVDNLSKLDPAERYTLFANVGSGTAFSGKLQLVSNEPIGGWLVNVKPTGVFLYKAKGMVIIVH